MPPPPTHTHTHTTFLDDVVNGVSADGLIITKCDDSLKDMQYDEDKAKLILFVGNNPDSHTNVWHLYKDKTKWLVLSDA